MKSSVILVSVASCVMFLLFIFKPNNVEGPRVEPVRINERGFPYRALNDALTIALPQGRTPKEQELVRYDQLNASPKSLDHYLGLIAEVGPRVTPHRFIEREERLAFFLNAYTAGLLAIVRDACPLERVGDPYWFNGLFWRVSLRVGGAEMSLSDIAAEALSLSNGDYRVLLALTHGDLSSLPLRGEAWHPHHLEEGLAELDKRLFLPPFVEREGDTLWLGVIFKRYEHRFRPNPRKYIAKHHPELVEGARYVKFREPDDTLRGLCEASARSL